MLERSGGSAGKCQLSTPTHAALCSRLNAGFLGQIWDNLPAKPCQSKPISRSSVEWRKLHNQLYLN